MAASVEWSPYSSSQQGVLLFLDPYCHVSAQGEKRKGKKKKRKNSNSQPSHEPDQSSLCRVVWTGRPVIPLVRTREAHLRPTRMSWLRGANDFLYRARQGQSSTSIKERERRIERPPTAPVVDGTGGVGMDRKKERKRPGREAQDERRRANEPKGQTGPPIKSVTWATGLEYGPLLIVRPWTQPGPCLDVKFFKISLL